MASREDIWIGLDVGTTKISAIVGEVDKNRGIDIVGIGTAPSKGLKKGMVINIESTVASIKQAVEEAERMADVEIRSVYTGIAGGHIKGINSRGVIAVKDREVRRADVERVIEAAKAVAIPLDREVLHVLPQEFIVDSQDGVKDPLGMSGVRLESDVHIITGAATSSQNIVKCVNQSGLEVLGLILQPLASSEAVLTSDEKELGVAVVDIGGGTTDVAIFVEGAIRHTAILAMGGSHFTNDIAIGLRTPPADAEKLKITYGCASTDMVKGNEMMEVPSVGGRPPRSLSRQLLAGIIKPRAEEIFALVAREIEKMDYGDKVASGVVITGGCSRMEGMVETAESVLGLPVRRGNPFGVGGLVDIVSNPMHATGVGLILYAYRNYEQADLNGKGTIAHRVKNQMKNWVKAFF